LSEIRKPRPLSRRVPWQLVVVFILLAAGLLALSRVFFTVTLKHARAFMESELATVAGLKADQLRAWREERLAFAQALQANPANAQNAKTLAARPNSAAATTDFRLGMAGLQKSLPFTAAVLVLPGGRSLAAYPGGASLPSTPESMKLGHEAWQDGRPILGTVVLDEKTGSRTIDLMIPLAEGDAPPKPVALLRMSFDAASELDPLLSDWPNRRPTAEALLLQVEGENFVRLSLPRLYNGPTPPPPIPVASFHRPGAQGALGQEGIVEGRDYRRHQVLEYLRAVPGSPWLVAVKTDLAELTSGMPGRELLLSAIAAALVLVCGTLLYVFWRRTLTAQEQGERTKWDDANRHMDELMRQLIDVMPNPAFFKDTQGRYVGTNAAFERLLGRSKSELEGKTIADVAAPEIARLHEENDLALLAESGHRVYQAPLQASDGEHDVIFIKMTYRRPDGTIGGLIGILRDITQRLQAEKELEQLRRFSESISQTMTEGLVLTDSDGRFSFVNPAAAQMLGYTPGEMVDQAVLSFVPKEQHAAVRKADEKRAKGIADRYELDFLRKDGARRTFLVSGGPRVQGAQFGGTMAVLTDITERKRMEEEIRALSLHDELTGLYNRRGFMTLAEHTLKTATRMQKTIALIYLDVDNLKRINDTSGHKTGDRALVEIGFVLKKSFRESDIIGRLGGDEFAVLAMEGTTMNPEQLTRRLQERLDLFNARSSAEVGFTLAASVGVATREPDRPDAVEELLSRADLLMYEQKRLRKGGDAGKPPGPSK
jgi:diguanylate cyclase (GGDEF)-like protein/PAS domain S-box-containing protein